MKTIWNSPCKIVYQTFHSSMFADGHKITSCNAEQITFKNYHAALKWFWRATENSNPPLNADFYINERWSKNIVAMSL